MSKRAKDMVEGCCVCSDEHGYSENPIVYCDGCNIAVHQACYGIVAVPDGPWFCRKCETSERTAERTARVRCELCPFKEGALKKTDSNGWAHVVCALYIPEVRFGNVTTMEPIVLNGVPPERFARTCYICVEEGRANKSSTGACMQCNKAGCKQQFHVLCGQTHKLLCEETGNQMDNVKYCGYCQHHTKTKKGSVKGNLSHKPSVDLDAFREKETSGKKKSYLAVGKNILKKSQSPSPDLASVYNMDLKEEEEEKCSSGVTLKFSTTSSHSADTGKVDNKNKFTTSNFVETVVTQSEPVFGSEKSEASDMKGKKRKSSSAGIKSEGDSLVQATNTASTSASPVKPVSVTLSQLKPNIAATASKSTVSVSGLGKMMGDGTPPPLSAPKGNLAVFGGPALKITIASRDDPKKIKTEGNVGPQSQATENADGSTSDAQPVKRLRSESQEKGRKKRPQNKRATPVKDEPDSGPESPDQVKSKKKSSTTDEKAELVVPHMLGNQLNPASTMAQSMHDTLNQEVEAHSIYCQEPQPSVPSVAPPVPRKFRATTSQNDKTALSAANSLLSLGNSTSSSTTTPSTPQGIAELLERQWEQGNQFFMEQAQHFDIATLLTGLHQLRRDNTELEEQIVALNARRDHLLAVSARLQLSQQSNAVAAAQPVAEAAPEARTNGVDAHHYVNQLTGGSQPAARASSLAYASAQRRPPVLSSQYHNHPQNGPIIRRDDSHQM